MMPVLQVGVHLGAVQEEAQTICNIVPHSKHQSGEVPAVFDVWVGPLVGQQQGDAVEGVVDESQLEGGAVQFVNLVETIQVLTGEQHAKSFHIVPVHSIVEGS